MKTANRTSRSSNNEDELERFLVAYAIRVRESSNSSITYSFSRKFMNIINSFHVTLASLPIIYMQTYVCQRDYIYAQKNIVHKTNDG